MVWSFYNEAYQFAKRTNQNDALVAAITFYIVLLSSIFVGSLF